MRTPHARPMWQIQAEEIERQRQRDRHYARIRKGIEYGSYIAFVSVLSVIIVMALNEAGGF